MERPLPSWMEDLLRAWTLTDWTTMASTSLLAILLLVWIRNTDAWRGSPFRKSHLSDADATKPESSSSRKRNLRIWQNDNDEDGTVDFWQGVDPPPSFVIRDEQEQQKCQEIVNEYNSRGSHVTHFCFLTHGHRGFRKDLSYLHTVMEMIVNQKKLELVRNQKDESYRQDLIVHNVLCNEHKTADGVINGGDRLVQEIFATIREAMPQRPIPSGSTSAGPEEEQLRDVTVSFVGNSLGGIYNRYAISQFEKVCGNKGLVLDGKYRLHYNVFCTTASPHLGLSKLTFLPMPRGAEIGLAHTLGDTGRDLFRLNGLMKAMATSSEFLKPLGRFRKRLAYANAYGTDFPVPPKTAAFLSTESSYPHHFVEDSENGSVVVDETGLVIATVQTPAGSNSDMSTGTDNDSKTPDSTQDDLVQMSNALDSLGWKKVFVDIRNEIPYGMSIPRLTPTANDDAPLHEMKQKKVVSSRDVASAMEASSSDDARVVWPLGHNMMVAFSRTKTSTQFNKGGRPVMDALAKEVVDDIFSWRSHDQDSVG